MNLVADLTLVLLAALAGGVVAHRLRQPLIVGYIVAGVAVGPFTGGITVSYVHDIEQFAELGAMLLLFSIGLEVSFAELAPVRAVAIGGGAIQIVVTMALGWAIATRLGFAWQPALWFGGLIALSSTMVALKTLQAQGRLGTLSSRVMLGILVVQDLAVVPLMIVLPELSRPGSHVVAVLVATGRALALLAAIVYGTTRLIPRLLGIVVRQNSRELFLLATIAIALGIGYLAWLAGLSLALGAFIAGLVLNGSDFAHQALSDVAPLRDVFGMLFFVSVGMLLDPAFALHHAGTLAVIVAVVIVGKGALLALIVRLFGYRRVIPLASGLTLFQIGEFAFVLAQFGLASGAIDRELYSLTLNAAVATMALTPILSSATPFLYQRAGGGRTPEPPERVNVPAHPLTGHVIVAGAGRVGRTVADALRERGLPFVLIEADARRVQQARDAGLPLIRGDATQPGVLRAAGLEQACTLLITVPAFPDVRAMIHAVREARPDLPIAARADRPEAVRGLYELGVEEVVSPELEAAVEMMRHALVRLAIPAERVLEIADEVRRERYPALGEGGSRGSP
jgi:CPA2 family monovalent cation:H+ antiporter-2